MPIYKGSEKIKDICIAGQNTNCLTHIPQDVKVELDPLNATIVGSPTISKGVVSGFSASNYLNLPKKFNPGNKTWEIGLKITTPSTFADYNYMIGNSTNNYQNIVLETNYNKLRWLITTSGTTYDYAVNSELTLDTSTTYYLRYAFTGSEYVCDVSTDNKTWERAITIESPTPMFAATEVARIGNNMGNYNWGGSIDISQCYIKINGSTWWKGGTDTLIVKAGSKVYIPDGFESDGVTLKFDEVVIESDLNYTASVTDSNKRFVYYNKDNRVLAFFNHSSGTTVPTTGANQMVYNTSDNTIKRYNNGALTDKNWSLPLGIITANGRVTVGNIDQIFNGFGYIGSTAYALPGVKGIIPNGRNSDGTTNNIEVVVNDISTLTLASSVNLQGTGRFLLDTTGKVIAYVGSYDAINNYVVRGDGTTKIIACVFVDNSTVTAGVINSFKPKAVESPLKPVYIDKVYKGSTLVYQGAYKANQVVFEKSTAGTYSVNLEKAGLYEITVVGGGGAAAMRGVYDDKGYGWTGGSGGAFVGTFVLERGTRKVIVAKANNNTTAQTSNSQTSNPTDTGTYASIVEGVVSVGGGGSGHYNSSYVGGAGAAANLTMTPTTTTLNTAGNAGNSGSGGKGGGAGATINGGASVYNGYGKGQGCVTSEYANKRSWINGTGGYVKIVYKGRRP